VEFLESYREFPVRILRLKPQINQQIIRTAIWLIVRMNFVYKITSEISGATEPPRLDKFKIKKMKMAILDTGGKFKITVMSLWIKVIIQPIPEQIVRKMDLIHNSKFTAGMHRVILLLTKKKNSNVMFYLQWSTT
jgi:hypothetical protein